jgi:histidinol-phosphate/aromatic aminotransferase/cobyric acid decarboxylase-like protein
MQIYGKYESHYREACRLFAEERISFFDNLKKISFLRVIPSQANYFLCEVLNPYTASELTKKLLSEFNILIKDCSAKKVFEGKEYVRIAIRNRDDNEILIRALEKL